MSEKTYIESNELGQVPQSQIGASLEALSATIEQRKAEGDESSYTHRLLKGPLDSLLKKVCEEATEVALAAKECEMLDAYVANEELFNASVDHLRYEAGDVVYHLSVLLARFGIDCDELAAEVNTRMTEEERPCGGVRLHSEFVKRGK
jgi:phosphoribosyl-ATP pyrophosphohydrolase/phosphoribosyl-ATP pyrophosphohydrolase/phosphoribosyl-AMP cyclohydrolase